MNDLISRSALLEELSIGTIITDDLYGMGIMAGTNHSVKKIKAAPAVDAETVFEAAGLVKKAFDMAKADLVAVVRCKDCKWLCSGFDTYSCAKHTGLALIKPNGSSFCSYGERRADDADALLDRR